MKAPLDFLIAMRKAIIRTSAAADRIPPEHHLGLLKTFLDDSDLFLAVFASPDIPDGTAIMVLKGKRKMKKIFQSGFSNQIKLGAVGCYSLEDALEFQKDLKAIR